ncbi:hypothetical protein BGX28_002534 [Mortierella sp. GBA30]|nr:hypothetical protein BGX28_002534 [Mortierella sp. GBA30]
MVHFDKMLLELLARFRSALKPQTANFTKQLPNNVESNPVLITAILIMFEDFGLQFAKDTPDDLTSLGVHLLAQDFITVMKNERPDVIYSMATGDFT